MKHLSHVLVSWLLSAGICFGAPPDSLELRRAAAIRYAQVSPMDGMLKAAVIELSKRMPEDQKKGFQEFMLQHVRSAVLEEVAINSMVKHFTAQELNAIADFYGSPVGRSAMKKFGVYMADVMPAMQQEIMRAAKAYDAARKQAAAANK